MYNDINIIKNPSKIDVLVNKSNKLPDNYIPKDLLPLNSNYTINMQYLRKEAKYHFEKLCADALKEGYIIKAVSTYRTSDYQEKLYNNYCLDKGIEYASICSAKKNHSEHQTGLAVDVADNLGNYNNFENTEEFKWMKNNSYKYGFILRYPKYKTDITGYIYEPWHYRYVGNYLAKQLYKNNLTLEEYKKSKE